MISQSDFPKNIKTMLKLNVKLNRASGGEIPEGAIILYQITTQPQSNEVLVRFKSYLNKDAIIEGLPALPALDIKEFQAEDGTPVEGAKFTPSENLLVGLTINKVVDITDEIVKNLIESQFLSVGDCESIGDTFPA